MTNPLRDSLLTGIILVDSKKKVASLNDPAKELLGLNPDRLELPALAALPAELRDLVREVRASAVWGVPEARWGRPTLCMVTWRTPVTSVPAEGAVVSPMDPSRGATVADESRSRPGHWSSTA